MKRLSQNYVFDLVNRIEKRLNRNLETNRIDKAIGCLKALSFIRYKFYIGYRDNNIENAITHISFFIKRKNFNLNGDDKSIVMIDDVCADSIGLTQQYLEALIQGGYRILYLYKEEFPSQACTKILSKLNNCNTAQIVAYPQGVSGIKLSQWLYEQICDFGSYRLLGHLVEWPIEESIALSALPDSIAKFRIVLADHTFWAGVDCFNYFLEFRHYGCNLSLNRRNLKIDQILFMPFYPIVNQYDFLGFPKEAEGKVVILSGGSLYKIVDCESTYFKICKEILESCPNSVILFAGGKSDDPVLSKAIERFSLKKRFIPIGYRRDIYEVFSHSDVYLDTFPIGGGLMLQYAAHCSKPILLYKNEDLEECVCQKSYYHFSIDKFDILVKEAKHLYYDRDYRKECGAKMKKLVVTDEIFNNLLFDTLMTRENIYPIKWESNFCTHNLNIEDAITFNNNNLLYIYFKLNVFLGIDFIKISPINFISLNCIRIRNKLFRVINKLLYKYV